MKLFYFISGIFNILAGLGLFFSPEQVLNTKIEDLTVLYHMKGKGFILTELGIIIFLVAYYFNETPLKIKKGLGILVSLGDCYVIYYMFLLNQLSKEVLIFCVLEISLYLYYIITGK